LIDWIDETLKSLDELARIVGSGVTADTLKHLARKGNLVVYRPGKAYVSTLADVWKMVQATRVKASVSVVTPNVPNGLGLSEYDLATVRCEGALRELRDQVDEKKRINALRTNGSAICNLLLVRTAGP
jgi:hypothetical protein